MTDPTKNNKMVRVGFPFEHPHLVYFELFEGEHPSKKIYSIQRRDWESFVSQLGANQDPAYAFSVPESEYSKSRKSIEHLKVAPSPFLRAFMDARNINLPSHVYIQPYAFEFEALDQSTFDAWEDTATTIVEGEVHVVPDTQEPSSNKGKVLLAALVAAISLLK